MSRPILLPGLRRLWRGSHSLQLGTDPVRAVVLDLADPGTARVLDLLDGTRTERAVITDAAGLGVRPEAAAEVLAALRHAGLVVGAHALLPGSMIEPVRRRLLTEAVALALRGSDARSPADALRRRADARVLVTGYGRLAVPIAAALAQAGVGHIDPALEGRAGPQDCVPGGIQPGDGGEWRSTAAGRAVHDAAPRTNLRPLREATATFVVQAGMCRPAELTALSYGRRGIPHLVVDIRDGLALVGPLVPAGGAPCLNCLDQYRRDHDPAWPALAAQMSTGRHLPQPCATATALAAVAYAVDDVLAFLDGGTPQTLGTTIEISSPGRERRRRWPAHPRCDCTRRYRARTRRAGTCPLDDAVDARRGPAGDGAPPAPPAAQAPGLAHPGRQNGTQTHSPRRPDVDTHPCRQAGTDTHPCRQIGTEAHSRRQAGTEAHSRRQIGAEAHSRRQIRSG